MFLGEFIYTIDDKGRLTIPAKFRGNLDTGLVVTKGIDRCLVIYPMDVWRILKERIANLPMTDRNARAFRRLLFSGASDTVPDSQGRITIPQPLREYGELDGQVVVAGCDTYIEVWNPEEWEKIKRWAEQGDDSAERWATLNI